MPPAGAAATTAGASPFAARLDALRRAFAQGQVQTASPEVQALHDEALTADAWRDAAEAALLLAKGHANREQPLPAQQWAERAAEHALRAGAADLEAAAWVLLASERARALQPVPAMQAVGHVLRRMAEVDDPRAVATVFTGVTLAFEALGLDLHALDSARRALQAGLALADDAILLRLRINVVHSGLHAWDQLHEVDSEKAAALLDELRWPLEAIDRTTDELAARGLPGRTSHDFLRAGWLVRAGDDVAAAPLLQALVDEARDMPPGLMAEGWLLHGELQRRRGEDGSRSAARALELAERFADEGSVWLRRRARAEDLAGRPDAALPLLLRGHARQMASVRAALDARVDELAAHLVDLHLRDENRQLRAHNQGLQADVRQYSRLAETDMLTGLPNRRALEAEFEARRGDAPLALAVLDLDHFKRINDRFSHLVGDAVLRQAAALMSASLRAPDLLARLGGEEFVALAALAPDEAAGAFERVRRALAEHAWGEVVDGLQVTVSIGVTGLRPGEDLATAMARADALLYRAKHEGRDRVLHDAG